VSKLEIESHSSDDTIARGREIGAQLSAPLLILLSGDLGAGKTTLTKGLASGFGAASEEEITSPTFTLVHRYSGASVPVYHVDLYRIEGTRDLHTLGLEDVFAENAIVIVEWPDRLKMHHDWTVLRVHLEHVADDSRRILIDAPFELATEPNPLKRTRTTTDF
jgi:tRNA threonylcarbamoyladenosine biosynthesis protein TsaE